MTFWEYILINLGVEDYIAFGLCSLAVIFYEWQQAHAYHPENFNAKILLYENWRKWVASLFCGLAMLYILPDGIFEIGGFEWNTLYSGAVGLSPMLIFKQVWKISKSKIRQVMEDEDKKEFGL